MPNSALSCALYTALMQVPPGSVVTYGQLAQLAGRPGAARWAGSVLKALPEHTKLPWHRVIAANGRISLPGDAATKQRRRLEAEGIVFKGDKVPLAQYGFLNR
ncbi:MGMT family protein [Gilvimarinus sp. SDUM040013]|uniref:MGMT family protein n=1 Tax=Gilvimarinus gilvus TaxID=3058038 RepID=A0ABU4RT07_9GAMM|nr:MGMT family protein [Gilvimarinus sp. SDUM040013]MDO3387083.1 MGMT family protein [Gilvimarinus sp. SDUM040013]MDX6848022.1 MGMT family protein [Gilvimarinus sp. SDUM040013]